MVPLEQVLMEIKYQRLLQWPERMNAPQSKRSKGRYCLFHRDHDHATQDCFDLKKEVKELIQRGYLKEYVEDPKATQNGENDSKSPAREIRTIMGGPMEREFGRKRKASIRETRTSQVQHEIYHTFVAKQPAKIEFSEDEATHLLHPHNDVLVITLKIANAKVHRILVDGGSSADIISLTAYKAMDLGERGRKSSPASLVRFRGERVIPEGRTELTVTFGSGPKSITTIMDFLVIDYASSYNAILGRPTIHMLKAIPSTYHQSINFPTHGGIGEIKEEQRVSRECYYTSMKGNDRASTAGGH
ncbi:uncharacterized protein LOC111018300 [Momordica charantia]|uniref:Uncharacterized protein LOC111018300 n=1 Tax=Momordica charantia TaxID=3673 RepID=A0A6J1D8C9_MOMCH|nr:uncharacterized protein LOC111018300 [Momordica charantia]